MHRCIDVGAQTDRAKKHPFFPSVCVACVSASLAEESDDVGVLYL